MKNTQDNWAIKWKNYFATYVVAKPRQAYYLNAITRIANKKLLEIGAGSFRDTVQLNNWGYTCTGVDYSHEAVQMAQEYYGMKNCILQMDATKMDFADKSFDISFHNGFFVCFNDDQVLETLVLEQARVTEQMMICTVHNTRNLDMVTAFKERAKTDDLYDVRWFSMTELRQLLEPVCSKIEFYPFGVPLLERFLAKNSNKSIFRLLYRFCYRYIDVSKCERIMVVGYLK